jgi:hypothetical protein
MGKWEAKMQGSNRNRVTIGVICVEKGGEVASGAVFKPNFVKTRQLFQTLKWGTDMITA